ncbi:hypothetical protein HY634_04575 [Candidatus Uhrbacteria bacterium]|nr:hypothetical protein [Candidatus Uhrbacteria bacterium]
MRKMLIRIAGALVVVGGAAFYGGMRYERMRPSLSTERGDAQNFRNLSPEEREQRRAQFGGAGGGGMVGRTGGRQGDAVIGEIIASNATSVTVKLRDGGTKTVLLADRTEIGKSIDGTRDDLVVGTMVFVNGSANSDGSVTAQSIQIRPSNTMAPSP